MYQSKSSDAAPKAASATKVPRRSKKVVELNRSQPAQAVRQLNQNSVLPPWLKSLVNLQQGAKIVFMTVLGTIPIVYGYTVYTQDLWRSQHGQLNRLQSTQQQQLVMTENINNQMAEAAEQSKSGLVAPTPARMVFIPGAQPRPLKQHPQPRVGSVSSTESANVDPVSQTAQGY